MPAIASLEDLKAAQKDLLEAKDLNGLKAVFKKWRRIGWKNVCKLFIGQTQPHGLNPETKLACIPVEGFFFWSRL